MGAAEPGRHVAHRRAAHPGAARREPPRTRAPVLRGRAREARPHLPGPGRRGARSVRLVTRPPLASSSILELYGRVRWSEVGKLDCTIARTLSVIGDRWTLLILRDAFLGTRRFEAFQASLGITRHRLADRLGKLVQHGVLRRERYQNRR